MANLAVSRKILEALATHQQRASEYLETGGKASDKLGWNTWWSHGPICGNFNNAVVSAEPARLAAGTAIKKVSDALHGNLLEAAKKYADTDEESAKNLDKQVMDR
jgi:hypothetical protein